MQQLDRLLEQVFTQLDLPLEHARVTLASRPDLCDYQCNAALALAKPLKKAPRQIAELIATETQTLLNNTTATDPLYGLIDSIEIAGPGFLNIKITNTALAQLAQRQLSHPQFGCELVKTPQTIVLDFGGPNVAKEMHVGHLRCAIVGESIQRMLKLVGHTTISDVHLGDWGLPYGKTIYELSLQQPDLPYFNPNHQGDYPAEPLLALSELTLLYKAGNERCKNDPAALEAARQVTAQMQQGTPGYRALWQDFVTVSIDAIQTIYKRLDIHFDHWFGESHSYPYVATVAKAALSNNLMIESDGAQVIHVAEASDGNNPLPPLMIYKTDGAVTYGATDLATIYQRRKDFHPDSIVYIVDKRQGLHFQQVFRAAEKMQYTQQISGQPTELIHIGYGTINGADGKPLKTRDGEQIRLAGLLDDVVKEAARLLPDVNDPQCQADQVTQAQLNELAESVAIAAIKFNDMKNHTGTDYNFDIKQFTRFEGKTGPYLQYAVARINSLLEKAGSLMMATDIKGDKENDSEQGIESLLAKENTIVIENEFERKLVFLLLQFDEVVHKAVAKLEPSIICDHAFDIAQTFSRFYTECKILGDTPAQQRASRLAISLLTKQILSQELYLLGINTPQRIYTQKQ